MPELLRRDVHPAEVMLPGAEAPLRACRVFVTSHRLIVYQVVHGEMMRTLDVPLSESVQARRDSLNGATLELPMVEGGKAFVNAEGGCGCGSILKSMRPPVPWVPQ